MGCDIAKSWRVLIALNRSGRPPLHPPKRQAQEYKRRHSNVQFSLIKKFALLFKMSYVT